jgi:hypothetical protein
MAGICSNFATKYPIDAMTNSNCIDEGVQLEEPSDATETK